MSSRENPRNSLIFSTASPVFHLACRLLRCDPLALLLFSSRLCRPCSERLYFPNHLLYFYLCLYRSLISHECLIIRLGWCGKNRGHFCSGCKFVRCWWPVARFIFTIWLYHRGCLIDLLDLLLKAIFNLSLVYLRFYVTDFLYPSAWWKSRS